MRFKTPLLKAIRDREKTVTRRLKCSYKPGRVYSATNRPRFDISGMKRRDEWFSVPIRVVSIRQELLSDVTEAEAVREGFRPLEVGGNILTARDQFFMAWGAIHGWPLGNPSVYRIEFTLAPSSWLKAKA